MTRRDTGKVNVNRNPHEGSALPYPAQKVLGILPDEDAAWQAIDELTSRGFAEEGIDLWGGKAGFQAIQESFSQSGLIGRLKGLMFEFGEEGDITEQFDEALQAGRFLLVVPAPNAEAKETVRDTMVKHGGHHIFFFDDLTIETLAR